MANYTLPKLFTLADVPEFKRFQAENPGHNIDGQETSIMFGRAIHWLSFLEVLWPPFDKEDFYMAEVKYLIYNDPDREQLPETFYKQIAETLKTFWTIQLTDLYPQGNWEINIEEKNEYLVEAIIHKKKTYEKSGSELG